jgi:hypothetical protein
MSLLVMKLVTVCNLLLLSEDSHKTAATDLVFTALEILN